ncbi:hypothetical protein DCAR_0101076 [Daucus carota subsp. sativus]|uniref:Uncharacterized protein n=1 Tax=Daucus carota subsp. sativus TaxID=79200 RepID=A0A166G4C5_DAUCS|nr:PREDICTED: AP2/ERF and B3 domain-containing transcription factor RAV1-like [Daucus carota subsp. sativus]WOG81920.1 hypothetical protein DCAR_0101076 [Daucus carota subsp. sativus]
MDQEMDVVLPPERVKLFDKVVTSSDIKQHRLAIPKYHARMHFPLPDPSDSKGSLLRMQDNEGKMWRFRFIFWKSYQGYVLTSEWNQFVREKGLSAGDTVWFYRSTAPDMQLYIDYTSQAKSDVATSNSDVFEQTPDVREFKLFGVTINFSL